MTDDAPSLRRQHRIGLIYALGAFTAWGVVLPIYLKALADVPVLEILAHRIVWGALFALALVAGLGRWRELSQLLVPRTMALLLVSALLVTINWVTYIYAVSNRHIVETSLGYFMNPLVSVALGMLVLGERLRLLQLAACLVAGAGVAILAATTGGLPWIALTLAFSFGFYGLVRKVVAVESLIGFSFEASILAPIAALYLLWLWASGQNSFGLATPARDALLLGAGVVTALPLIWFAASARKLPLTTIGLLQFSSPSATFLLGVFVYDEPFSAGEATTFACIWLALLLYAGDAVRARAMERQPRIAARSARQGGS
ncbi:MAG TPA: EamA family transporter RarD [Stellaceae bacterium]|nr:EamA family transporter RarD [Stellaceae bacterium]